MSFLGVSNSATGRQWVGLSLEEERLAETLTQAHDYPAPLAAVLARRGVAPAEAPAFLEPKLKELMPDPRVFLDMEKAGTRLMQAILKRERIAIFADYDVDGGSSAALLISWLRDFGLPSTLYIPDRIDEGYGPNVPAMEGLAAKHDLIICVDCGTLSHEPIAAAKKADVIVLDHHLGGETLPEALAVVNPNRQDESGDYSYLCAAGVVFMAIVETNRQLRGAGHQHPNPMSLLDLVALATVADVAPLVGFNRALVRQGLTVMGQRARTGIVALSDEARIDKAPTSYHLGYILGPRVNAGGRIGKADLGARLLASTDVEEAKAMAAQLEALNSERRAIEAAVRESAMAQAEARGLEGALVWAAEEGWHPGVVGIVASRLKEATNRPSVVIGFDGEIGKGSARSITGVDLGAAVQRLASEGLLLKGGGHKMAAGLTVEKSKLEAAMARLEELLAKQGAGAGGPRDLKIDSLLMPGAATLELVQALEKAGPFGASSPAPRFALPDCVVHFSKVVGTDHLKVTLGDGLSARIEGIAFNAASGPLGQILQANGPRVHVVGRLDVNSWQGRQSVQIQIEDAARA